MTVPQRNDPCSCGSGKKYKKCCMNLPAPSTRAAMEVRQGVAKVTQGQWDNAIAHFQQALNIEPGHPEALLHLGAMLHRQGRSVEAIPLLLQAVEKKPDFAEAFAFLAMASQTLGDYENGVNLLRHAVVLEPRQLTHYLRLSKVLQASNEHQQAVDCLLEAATACPDKRAEIYCEIAMLYLHLKQFEHSIEFLKKALELKHDMAMALLGLGNVYFAMALPDDAIASLRELLRKAPDNAVARSNMLFMMQSSYRLNPTEVFEAHREYGRIIEGPLKKFWRRHANVRDPMKRLRIGYVSADFHQHSVTVFFHPILSNHDRSQVETYCYYNNTINDGDTQALKALAEHWIPCREMTDDALAARIRADGIDILVDLSGHSARNRLPVFARKPAPVQMTFIGYVGTTGLESIDYRISDQYLDPPGVADALHTERLLRLTASATLDCPDNLPEIMPLPALHGAPFTLGCLNSHAKFSADNIALWAEILKRIPDARMMFGNAEEELTRNWLIDVFAQHGVGSERLMMMPRVGPREFLMMHQQIDLALDTFPYNGGTTTWQALRMGVPVVTLTGDRSVSRCGSAAMCALGLDEFVAQTPEEYLAIVQRTTANLPLLDAIRQGMRTRWRNSAMGNPAQFTRELESAYRSAWAEWCETGT